MSRKMKQIMLAVILMVMMCAVSPARKVSAEVLNSPQQIVWGQSYSGELEDAQNTYEYTFTMKKSGTFSLAIATEEIGKTHTGLNYIKVSDMYDNEIYTACLMILILRITQRKFSSCSQARKFLWIYGVITV